MHGQAVAGMILFEKQTHGPNFCKFDAVDQVVKSFLQRVVFRVLIWVTHGSRGCVKRQVQNHHHSGTSNERCGHSRGLLKPHISGLVHNLTKTSFFSISVAG